MSDHLDAPELQSPNVDARVDICDIYVFQQPGDADRSVFVLNVNPLAPRYADAFASEAVYELKVDTNADDLAEIAYRFTFSPKRDGVQTATVRRAEGELARGSGKEGEILFQNVPVAFGEAFSIAETEGYRFFAGIRSDPFFFDLEGYKNGMQFTGADTFLDKNVFSIVLELPNHALGSNPKVGIWARVLIPKDGNPFFQVDRMGRPLLNAVFMSNEDKNTFNHVEPTRDRTLFACKVIERLTSFGRSFDDALQTTMTLLPDILNYDYTSSSGYPNGRTLTDDIGDIQLALLTNGTKTMDLAGPHQDLLEEFPYVGPPHSIEVLRGRDCVLAYLQAAGITHLFGVPGTNEIPIIDGTLDSAYGINYVSCLHENIAMGAAMGYARACGKPGAILVHVTPGVGHSLGNLFNAAKSHIPLIVLCGQQHEDLLLQEPLLASDVVQVAQQYTRWAYEIRNPHELPIVMQRALKLAMTPPCGPVFLSFPWEFLVQEVHYPVERAVTRIGSHMPGDRAELSRAAALLARAHRPIIVVGDGVGASGAWEEMQELAQLLGAPVYAEHLSSLLNYPNTDYHWRGELPPFQEKVQELFDECDVAFLCGFNAQAQLVIFHYEKGAIISNKYCRQWADCQDEGKRLKQVYLHHDAWEIGKNYYGDVAILGDIKTSLPMLCAMIEEQQNCEQRTLRVQRNRQLKEKQERWSGKFENYLLAIEALARRTSTAGENSNIDGSLVATTLGRLLKEQHVPFTYVNEAISDSAFFQKALPFAAPNSYLSVEGGSLGYSMAMSVGVSLALQEKEQLVINAVGDGSALFYPNLWWTVARYRLPILYIIMNNHRYSTLLTGLKELENLYPEAGIKEKDPEYLYLKQPAIDFVRVAEAFGLADQHGKPCGQVVSSFDELAPALEEALKVVREEKRAYVLDIHTTPLRQSHPAPLPATPVLVF